MILLCHVEYDFMYESFQFHLTLALYFVSVSCESRIQLYSWIQKITPIKTGLIL